MMRRMMIWLAAALMLVTVALADTAAAEPVYLDSTTIIDGDLIYYSGSIDGGEKGVYVMKNDGSDARKVADATADLLALSGSNLLIYEYDMETGDVMLGVLIPDGTLIPINDIYPGKAVAANGRFYWGVGSCAEDGSDIQNYFDSEQYYDYYPLVVDGGYLYYLDGSELSGSVYDEGSGQPMGSALCRMDLSDQMVEVISDVGTRFLGIENGLIYYTRDNFWCATETGSEEIQVNEGLFCAALDTLKETRLAEYPESDSVVDSYTLVKDGVVYGVHSDYSDEVSTCIIRVKNDGTKLDDIALDSEVSAAINWVEGDTLYASWWTIAVSEDDYIQQDYIVSINLNDGSMKVLNPESIDMLFYTEAEPAIRVVDGRIYFAPYDMERWSVCLKSMNVDGSDLKLLAHGISYAEG